MRVIISGGGTGGHVYPALAIAENLKGREPTTKIVFVGTEDGMENAIITSYDYEFRHIQVSGFNRKLSKDTFRSVRKAFTGFKEAWEIIRKIKPDIIIGTGGYVCGPVVLAGYFLGVKTCIQEQNALPGMTNRILGKFADKIFLGNSAALKYFPKNDRVVITGNPIRSDIMLAERYIAQKKLGLDPEKTTILVSGGSRGAMSINKAMLYVHEKLAGRPDVQVLHITGEHGYKDVIAALSPAVAQATNLNIVPYMADMPLALAVADLAVFRAGAIGMSELAARGVPSILVPYPYATGNHQEYNARAFEKENAAIVVRDRELNGDSLCSLIDILLRDKERLADMATSARALGKPEAARDITDNILEMIE